jgi:hypothetical protein
MTGSLEESGRKGERNIGTLSRLSVEGGGGSYHYYHAAFAVRSLGCAAGYVREDLADQVDGAADVNVHYEVEVGQGEGV